MEKDKEPGVSGKNRNTNSTWINPDQLNKQKKILDQVDEAEKGFSVQGRGSNLFGRTDLDNQSTQMTFGVNEDQIVEALKRSPEADIQEVEVRVDADTVFLEGLVDDIRESREIESIVRNVPGVKKIQNNLSYRLQQNEKAI